MQDKRNKGGGFLQLVHSQPHWLERYANYQEVQSSSPTEGNYFKISFLLFLSSTYEKTVLSDEIPVPPVPYRSYELQELNGGQSRNCSQKNGFQFSVGWSFSINVRMHERTFGHCALVELLELMDTYKKSLSMSLRPQL